MKNPEKAGIKWAREPHELGWVAGWREALRLGLAKTPEEAAPIIVAARAEWRRRISEAGRVLPPMPKPRKRSGSNRTKAQRREGGRPEIALTLSTVTLERMGQMVARGVAHSRSALVEAVIEYVWDNTDASAGALAIAQEK